jgi:hypothetical protein
MRLILADRFSIEVPEFASVVRTCPSSICSGESYALSYVGLPRISIFVCPTKTSRIAIGGKCTVSSALNRGDPNAPVFCEGGHWR